MSSRPTLLVVGGTLYWPITTVNTSGVLVDADSTPTVAVRKNNTPYTAQSVTVTKRESTTGIYDCTFSPESEVEPDIFVFEETAVISSVSYPNTFVVNVVSATPSLTGIATEANATTNKQEIIAAIPSITGLAQETTVNAVGVLATAIKTKTDNLPANTATTLATLATEANANTNKQTILNAIPSVSGLSTENNATSNKEEILDAIANIDTSGVGTVVVSNVVTPEQAEEVLTSGLLALIRGDSYNRTFDSDDYEDFSDYDYLWVTFKRRSSDPDSASIMKIGLDTTDAEDSGLLILNSVESSDSETLELASLTVVSTNLNLGIKPQVWNSLSIESGVWDLQGQKITGNVIKTIAKGAFRVTDDVTKAVEYP